MCPNIYSLGFLGVFACAVLGQPAGAPVQQKETTPDGKAGLAVTVQPAKAAFKEQEPLEFTIIAKNVTQKPLSLHLLSTQTWDHMIQVKKVQWLIKPKQAKKEDEVLSHVLKPGESIKFTLRFDKAFTYHGVKFDAKGQMQDDAKANQEFLKPGKYTFAFFAPAVDLAFGDGKQRPANWVGAFTGETKEFEITRR